jgi:hypothetical protein
MMLGFCLMLARTYLQYQLHSEHYSDPNNSQILNENIQM